VTGCFGGGRKKKRKGGGGEENGSGRPLVRGAFCAMIVELYSVPLFMLGRGDLGFGKGRGGGKKKSGTQATMFCIAIAIKPR